MKHLRRFNENETYSREENKEVSINLAKHLKKSLLEKFPTIEEIWERYEQAPDLINLVIVTNREEGEEEGENIVSGIIVEIRDFNIVYWGPHNKDGKSTVRWGWYQGSDYDEDASIDHSGSYHDFMDFIKKELA